MTDHSTVVVSDLISTCTRNNHRVLASYLRRSYQSNICTVDLETMFECLVNENKVRASMQFLDTFKGCIEPDLARSYLHIAVYGDPYLFQHAVNTLHPDIVSSEASNIFEILCEEYYMTARNKKIKIMLDSWADHIEYAVIEEGMVNYCINSYGRRTGGQGRTGILLQAIVEKFIDKIEGEGISIAMNACCVPQNLALMDTLFDRNLEQIHQNPSLMNHAILRCCLYRDIDTFAHILDRCGPCICVDALQFWADVGDIEAVSMILDISIVSEELIDGLHKIDQKVCVRYDVELAECLLHYVEQHTDIKPDPDYQATMEGLVLGTDNPHLDVPSTHWIQYDNAPGIPYHLGYY